MASDDLRQRCAAVLATKLPEHAAAALPDVIRLVEQDTAERIAAWLEKRAGRCVPPDICGACETYHVAAAVVRSGTWKEQS